jgi:lipoprotein-anchoring transpeptidase ErfK/SrfK
VNERRRLRREGGGGIAPGASGALLAAALLAAASGCHGAPPPTPEDGRTAAAREAKDRRAPSAAADSAARDSAATPPAPGAPPVRTEPPAPDPPLRLRLNLPAYRLDVLEAGAPAVELPVAIGLPEHPTPTGDFAVDEVVWNPWWYPPDREWARADTVTPPCPANPMGRVKLFFGELLYLHGTPAEASLGRALSHGCVRLSNADAIALARTVHRHASPDVARSELDALEADPRRTRAIRLPNPVPLAIVYETAEIRGGVLLLHPDVYGLGGGRPLQDARRALAAAGVEPTPDGRRRLEDAAARAARGHVTLPLRELTGGP